MSSQAVVVAAVAPHITILILYHIFSSCCCSSFFSYIPFIFLVGNPNLLPFAHNIMILYSILNFILTPAPAIFILLSRDFGQKTKTKDAAIITEVANL